MKLIKLKGYAQNNYDKEIIDRMSKDSEENLNNYIVCVISDLLNNIPIDISLKINAKNNINSYNSSNCAKVFTYTSLIPYIQLKLKDEKDVYIITTSYIEKLISYIIGYIDEDEFNTSLLSIKTTLKISDRFYDELINYFINNCEYIILNINKKI